MSIEFKTPEVIEKQLQPVRTIAEHVMRPESRYLDDHEHERPVKFVQIMWPQMKQMELANLEAGLKRAQKAQNGAATENGAQRKPQDAQRAEETLANMTLVHDRNVSWGDAGVYLCIPGSALGGGRDQCGGVGRSTRALLAPFYRRRTQVGRHGHDRTTSRFRHQQHPDHRNL
ncbi:MAG: hypothetical protein R3E79_44725 [Caldilineaceae bacterium]